MKLESAWALSSPSGVTREDKVAVIWSYFHDEILKCDKKVRQKHENTKTWKQHCEKEFTRVRLV